MLSPNFHARYAYVAWVLLLKLKMAKFLHLHYFHCDENVSQLSHGVHGGCDDDDDPSDDPQFCDIEHYYPSESCGSDPA